VTRLGLMCGGGGIVGIAWELGVMAGLQEAAGFDPGELAVIVGTSAGSVAGSQIALGKSLPELVAQQQRPPRQRTAAPAPARAQPSSGIGTSVVPEEIMALMFSAKGTMAERAVAIAKLAADVPVALTEDEYLASFETMLGTDEWPADVDLRLTTVEGDTGRTVLWTKDHGIGLVRAVASSCAIPGYFPSVGFDGHRYIDGPRGGFYRDIVGERGLEAILYIGPLGLLPGGLSLDPEMDELAQDGFPVLKITGGAGLAAVAGELMSPAARVAAASAGLDDGRDAANAFRALVA
jgi:NTE family protein